MEIFDLLTKFKCFDYETVDPYIDKGLGSGWVYKLGYPDANVFKVLGCGVFDSKTEETSYVSSAIEINPGDVLVGQNLLYDMGCWLSEVCSNMEQARQKLRELYKSGVVLIDTIQLAKLVDEHLMQYSLAALTKKYGIKQKDTKILADAVFDTGLYTEVKYKATGKNFANRPKDDKVLLKMAYKHLESLPAEIVQEYCITDVQATTELYRLLMDKLTDEYDKDVLLDIIKTYSTLQYAVMEMRLNGIVIDNNKLRENHAKLCKMLTEAQEDLNTLAGQEVKTAATVSIVSAFLAYGYKEDQIPRTASGNHSATQAWLEAQDNPLAKGILRVRKLNKIIGTFIDSLRNVQDELGLSVEELGHVHGEFIISGAKTGRFSSRNPNLQQIPKRDPEFYEVCRGMFIAGPGRKFIASDYSSQETRIGVHFGHLLGIPGATEIKNGYNRDPDLDFHQKVADICEIDRRSAKAINLGLGYGMGPAKLCHSLGLPTQMKKMRFGGETVEREVAGPEGARIIGRYNELFPFIKEATDMCREVQKERGYLRSLMGRHLHPEKYFEDGALKTSYFKAFNQLIQGSAADQLIKTLVDYYDFMCYNEHYDIKLIGVVHDEVLFTVPEATAERDVKKIEELMVNSVELEVPMLAETHVGDSWYEG